MLKEEFRLELNQCINFLLTTAQNAVFRHLSALLCPYGITPGQYGVLSCVWACPGASPGQIAEQLHLEASTVSSLLDRMQKNGLIEREVDPENRRGIRVVATGKALALEPPVQEIIRQVNDKVMAGFTDDQCAALRTALIAISELDL